MAASGFMPSTLVTWRLRRRRGARRQLLHQAAPAPPAGIETWGVGIPVDLDSVTNSLF